MALQNLAERSTRIVQSTLDIANTTILHLNAALQAQENFSRQLLADLWRLHIDANRMSIELTQQDEEIAQLREQNNFLRAGLASERLQGDVLRDQLGSERLLRTRVEDLLLRPQQNNLDAFPPHLEPALPEAISQTAEPAAPQTTQAAIPATLQSVPMSREPAYRRHGEPRAE